jgi:hypothetical protein
LQDKVVETLYPAPAEQAVVEQEAEQGAEQPQSEPQGTVTEPDYTTPESEGE